MRVFFIIQASINLLECILTAVISLGMGAMGVLNFAFSVIMAGVCIKIIIIGAKGGKLTSQQFAQLVNYYGLILMYRLFSANVEMPAEIAVNIVLCTAYVFMLISFWKPDSVKKVNFTGVLILFFMAGAGTCGIAGYQMYNFLMGSIEKIQFGQEIPDSMLKFSVMLSVIFSVCWCVVKFVLPTAILLWIGKHKDDEDKSIEIII